MLAEVLKSLGKEFGVELPMGAIEVWDKDYCSCSKVAAVGDFHFHSSKRR